MPCLRFNLKPEPYFKSLVPPAAPEKPNSSWLHSPLLSMLWSVSTHLMDCSRSAKASQYSMAAPAVCHSCT